MITACTIIAFTGAIATLLWICAPIIGAVALRLDRACTYQIDRRIIRDKDKDGS